MVPNLEQWKVDHPIRASSLTLESRKWQKEGSFALSSAHFDVVALPDVQEIPMSKEILQQTYKKMIDKLLQKGLFEKALNVEEMSCQTRMALVSKHLDTSMAVNGAAVRILVGNEIVLMLCSLYGFTF